MPRMTRDEMAQVIRDGGCVELAGRMILTEAALPTEADLAVGDPAQEATALAALQTQMIALQAQMTKLTPAAAPLAEDADPTRPGRK